MGCPDVNPPAESHDIFTVYLHFLPHVKANKLSVLLTSCVYLRGVAIFVCRETMLQALRFVIQGAGSKVDPAIRKNITTTLLGMLGHDEVR